MLPKRGLLELEGQDPGAGNLREPAKGPLFLFPDVVLRLQKDPRVGFTMAPVSVDGTRVTIQGLPSGAPADERAASRWATSRAIPISARSEVFVTGEELRAGRRARAFDEVIFGKNEPGPAAFHDGLDAVVHDERKESPR